MSTPHRLPALAPDEVVAPPARLTQMNDSASSPCGAASRPGLTDELSPEELEAYLHRHPTALAVLVELGVMTPHVSNVVGSMFSALGADFCHHASGDLAADSAAQGYLMNERTSRISPGEAALHPWARRAPANCTRKHR